MQRTIDNFITRKLNKNKIKKWCDPLKFKASNVNILLLVALLWHEKKKKCQGPITYVCAYENVNCEAIIKLQRWEYTLKDVFKACNYNNKGCQVIPKQLFHIFGYINSIRASLPGTKERVKAQAFEIKDGLI